MTPSPTVTTADRDDFIAADCEATYALIPMGRACARVGRRELRRVLTAHRRAAEQPLREEVERLTAANHDLLDSLQATAESLVQAESERNGAELLRDQAKRDCERLTGQVERQKERIERQCDYLEEAEKTVQLFCDELAALRSRPPIVAAPVGSYVPTGEVRAPKKGDWWATLDSHCVQLSYGNTTVPRSIYRRIEPSEHGAYTHVLEPAPKVDGRKPIVQFDGKLYVVHTLAPAAPQAQDDGFAAFLENCRTLCGEDTSIVDMPGWPGAARKIYNAALAARQAQETE